MSKGPDYSGGFGYGPWPDDGKLGEPLDPKYPDGYRNRMPGGGHYENPSDIWLDAVVYPERPGLYASDGEADRLDLRARAFRISQGNVTGKAPGPSEE